MSAQSFHPPVRTLMGPGPSDVNRRDFERTVRITADIDKEITSSAEANRAFAHYRW